MPLNNIIKRDGCAAIFDPLQPWYDAGMKYVNSDQQVCPTHHPQVEWNFQPLNFSLVGEGVGLNWEGQYKVIGRIKSYDATGNYKKESLCMQLLGEVYKV